MKKILFAFTLTISSFLSITPAIASNTEMVWDEAWLECKLYKDCTIIKGPCKWEPSNITYKQELMSYHMTQAPFIDCVDSPDFTHKPKALCIKNKCQTAPE